MRTNIVIDDELMARALEATGLKTKKAVVETALQTLITLQNQGMVKGYRGRLRWEGDLARSRLAR